MPPTRTQVCITIDTEFTIGGVFGDPDKNQPIGDEFVYGPANGRHEGLGFLLECFERHGIRATWFVETLNYFWFGDGPMGKVVERLLEADQDVQLHAHPVWMYFRDEDWRDHLKNDRRPNDLLPGRPKAEVVECLQVASDLLQKWGAQKPVAFRHGGLVADTTLYEAQAELGMDLASNLGIGFRPPLQPDLALRGGLHRIAGVVEAPVLTYRAWGKERILTVTGCSWQEMRELLHEARAQSVSPVVLLTHPFEFFKHRNRVTDIRKNRVNQTRLERLCKFLRDHDDEFEPVSFGHEGLAWKDAEVTENPTLDVSATAPLSRLVANVINDRVWWY